MGQGQSDGEQAMLDVLPDQGVSTRALFYIYHHLSNFSYIQKGICLQECIYELFISFNVISKVKTVFYANDSPLAIIIINGSFLTG